MTTALITGASSGIGAAFARALAGRGLDLILVARRAERLEALAEVLADRHGIRVTVLPADLSRPGAAAALAEAVSAEGLAVDWLVNNAGTCYYEAFVDQPQGQVDEMVALNIQALTSLARSFGAPMAERGQGVLINVASAAAFLPIPYGAVYAASKAYVLSFSEALSEELAPRGVKVLCLCPGSTESEIHAKAGTSQSLLDQSGMMTAGAVVEEALRALDWGQSVHVTGLHNQLGTALTRLVPRQFATQVAGMLFKPKGL
jgi:hypothetical protein